MSSSTSSTAPSPALGATWLTPEQAMAYLGLARSTFYRIVRDEPAFPRPRYISERNPRWNREAIDAWLESRYEAGDIEPAEATP